MVVNLNLNTQNLGTLYTDPTIGDNLSGSANLATQNEIGLYNPTDSISLSALAQSYWDGQPPPEQVPETVVVTGTRRPMPLASDAGFIKWLNDIDLANNLAQNLLIQEQNQSVILTQDKEPNIEGPYTQEDLDKIKQRILELRAQNAGKDAKLDAVYVWILNLIENANSKKLGVLDKLLLDRLVDFAQEHAKPSDLLNIMRDFLAAVYYGIKDRLNGPFNGPFEQPKPVGPDL